MIVGLDQIAEAGSTVFYGGDPQTPSEQRWREVWIAMIHQARDLGWVVLPPGVAEEVELNLGDILRHATDAQQLSAASLTAIARQEDEE